MATTRLRAARHTPALRAGALAVVAGLALAACSPAGSAKDPDSDMAQQLATQLDENLTRAGLPGLDNETATALYGTDGGATCENAGDLQHDLSLAQFGNNSGNLRRVVMDPSLLEYDLVVVQTYCPDKEDDLRDLIDDLKTEETIP